MICFYCYFSSGPTSTFFFHIIRYRIEITKHKKHTQIFVTFHSSFSLSLKNYYWVNPLKLNPLWLFYWIKVNSILKCRRLISWIQIRIDHFEEWSLEPRMFTLFCRLICSKIFGSTGFLNFQPIKMHSAAKQSFIVIGGKLGRQVISSAPEKLKQFSR